MKLYTRSGDDGTTGLIGGGRVFKDDLRVAAYGSIDEANAAIGAAVAACHDALTAAMLREIQSELFVLGAELATPPGQNVQRPLGVAPVARLEKWIDEASDEVPPLQNFILPGGTPVAAALHVARTVCRRAERAVVSLSRKQRVSPGAVIYLNRLSDLLFALARRANHRAGVADIPWAEPPGPAGSAGH